jgi:hypothetical protein
LLKSKVLQLSLLRAQRGLTAQQSENDAACENQGS